MKLDVLQKENYIWIFTGPSKLLSNALETFPNSVHWEAASVNTSCPLMSSDCSQIYPSLSLNHHDLFCVFPIFISWFLLVECVAVCSVQLQGE
jgi:hypothetical protein